jgi:hypothetical protein
MPMLRSAVRSPDGTSHEVLLPFSAINTASPLCDGGPAGNRRSTTGRGLASPAAFPPSGFLTLLTVCSSRHLTGLFRPAGAHGVVHPSELFPLLQPYRLSVAVALLALPPAASRNDGCLQGLAPQQNPPADRAVSSAAVRRVALLGFLPSRALPLLAAVSISRHLLSSFEASPGRCGGTEPGSAELGGCLFARPSPAVRSGGAAAPQSIGAQGARLASLESCRPSWGL